MSFIEHQDDDGESYYISDPINESNLKEYKEYLKRTSPKYPFFIYLSKEKDDRDKKYLDKNGDEKIVKEEIECMFMMQYYIEEGKKIVFWRGFIE